MRKCWEETPSSRPTFPDLVITLGQMIEHDDKEVYGDMNAPYLRMNASRPDYLIMRRLSQNLNSLEQNDLQIRRSGDCPSKSVLDNNTTHGKMIV
ncbi:hypothetical protein B566_EDAN014244 [Ephemera danica]|nr:hypothetical protein B566_EDAN014244 [Ephemera danica]